MRIAGILCEYNPFHTGHYEQIKSVKQKTDYLICLMSASFVQRGEPAMYDKFTRASWALKAGADAVLELPCLYSLRSAEGFSMGAMRIFEKIGIDTLYFGSECSQNALLALADVYAQEAPEYLEYFRSFMKRGLSYAAAREAAARLCIPGLPDEAFMRNAVLGIEYILALRRLHSSIQPVALPRLEDVSASLVRENIAAKDGHISDDISGLLPEFVFEYIPLLTPVKPNAISDALLYKLRSMNIQEYAALPGISEGFENRLYNAAQAAVTYDGLLSIVAHKRMPLSRIKRALMCALLGINQSHVELYDRQNPSYLRLLGMRTESKCLISHIQEHANIPVITQPAHHPHDTMLEKEIFATDVHALFAGLPAGQDFTRRLLTL